MENQNYESVFPIDKGYLKRKKIYNNLAFFFAVGAFLIGAYPVFNIIYKAIAIGYKYLNFNLFLLCPPVFL